jgi:16S rRNA (cytosine967-C5)-methyltransferase
MGPYVHRGLRAVDPPVRELLRIGAYQVLYLDGVPPYAAVSETVAQARHVAGARASGFVNAVLRRVVEGGADPDRFPGFDEDPVGHLSTWGSHPRWLVERWLDRWSAEAVRRLVEANNTRPPVHLVPLEATPSEAVEHLRTVGIPAEEVGGGSRCVRLGAGAIVPEALTAAGPAIVQDPAANFVSLFADVPTGTMVADLCASPGGKFLALPAARLRIIAADRSESRIHVMRENARRVGRAIACVVADALHPPLTESGAVLLDVPCTGTGTLARHPDARWRLRPEDVAKMAGLQSRMLDAAAEVVAPGGLLVYSTCSLEPEENAEQISAFLGRRTDYVLAPTDAVPAEVRNETGCLEVTPQEHGFDGSYAARMRRVS